MSTLSLKFSRKGQLGHENLENCNEPKLIRALAGLKIAEVSAGGWRSAAVTIEVKTMKCSYPDHHILERLCVFGYIYSSLTYGW